MKRIFLLLLFFSVLFAEDELQDIFDLELSHDKVIDARENFFLTDTDYKIAPKVNPITGEYTEEEVDLIVAGSQPLSLRRYYNSSSPYNPRTASWRYNPEVFFVANLELENNDKFASIGERDGSICSFKPVASNPSLFTFEVPKGYVAFQPDGKSHPLNTKITYTRFYDPKDKNRFEYRGTITDGSGRVRSFVSPMHRWVSWVYWTKDIKGVLWDQPCRYPVMPSVWTPFPMPVTEEKLPNGNIICMSYTQWKEEKKNYPLPRLIGTITAYNANKTKVLGFIHFHYPRTKHDEIASISATGSDQRTSHIAHTKDSIQLASAQRPGQPTTSYSYKALLLETLSKPEGREIKTEYNTRGQVVSQSAPVGPNGKICPIGRYEYQERATLFWDAEGNQTIYRYDANKKVTAIEHYQDKELYRIDCFEWDAKTGNLHQKRVEDANRVPLQITEYEYDKNQNPILEKVIEGRESRSIIRTFSDDGFNLKLSETDREGTITCYFYKPGTNLLTAELVYVHSQIQKRIFHTYDDCAICIQTIMDDGQSEDPHDLTGITYRTLKEIKPKQTLPCFGLPEVVEEKTLSQEGLPALLHKTVYTYAPSGKVLQEAHYDANGALQYTIKRAYDKEERLISQTDALGRTVKFTYDANHNLTTLSGPREGQRKEICYDKANRPIKITEHTSSGAPLITEKKYDKLGRVIEQKDPYQNVTRFEYRPLEKTTHHPDGGIERQEMDPFGNVIKEIDAEGYVTQKTYTFGKVAQVTHPDGVREVFTYYPTGELATHQERNGALSVYTYDELGHLVATETFSPEGEKLKSSRTTWTPFCKLSEQEGTVYTTYSYDFSGRKIAEKQDKKHITYTYDSLGRVTKTQESTAAQIDVYDTADQLIETRKENNGKLQFREQYEYDRSGNQTHRITSMGVTTTLFDFQNRPLKETDPLGYCTTHTYLTSREYIQTSPKGVKTHTLYDPNGRKTLHYKENSAGEILQQSENIYDKNGNRTAILHTLFGGQTPSISHRWEYGPMGRIERFLESDTRETTYQYDERGRLQTLMKPGGQTLTYTYDSLGRLIRFTSPSFDYHYTYDTSDRLLSVYDTISKTTTQRTYDTSGRLLSEKLANGLTCQNTYDSVGRRTRLTLPDNTFIDYIYDGHYLYQVKRKEHTHTYSQRNLEGEILQALLPNAKEITIERDKLGRYTRSSSPHFTATYSAYDGNGNLLNYQFQDSLGEMTCTFTYDDLDQLITENGHTYQFDSLYNRVKKDQANYTLDIYSQINSDGKTNYKYDPCGNLTSDGVYTYTYDSLDRLISIDNGDTRITYGYDPFNRRISKTHVGWLFNTYTYYIWDGENEIGAVSANGRIQELRVLGEGLGAEIGAAILLELGSKPYIPIHDHRGCLVALADLQGKKVESYRYTAFGEELTQNTLSPWRFASKRTDQETHLVYFGRRYYNPNLGRWITQDPEGFSDGPNLYAYLTNSPLTDFDPYGLWSWKSAFNGTKDFLYGAGNYAWSGVSGVGHGMGKMGEWMHADFQYEYFNDRSFFEHKSNQSIGEWKNFGQAFWNDPLGLVVPGIMDAWRNPTSPGAWGKASVDLATFAIPAAKGTQVASNLFRSGRVGGELATFSKVGRAAELISTERFSAPTKIVSKPLNLDSLSMAGQIMDRGGLTIAGRSLTKHGVGGRSGNSLFPAAKGRPFAINTQAKNIVDDILTSPGGCIKHSYRGRFGNTIEISAPDGRGIVYDANGKFLFFKE